MSIIAEKIYEAVKTLPDQDAVEVFDFVTLLQARQEKRRLESQEQPTDTDDWSEFERFAGAWSGKLNREECYDRPSLR